MTGHTIRLERWMKKPLSQPKENNLKVELE
jgi:hypothetical protein